MMVLARICHSERSEESHKNKKILRYAQNDKSQRDVVYHRKFRCLKINFFLIVFVQFFFVKNSYAESMRIVSAGLCSDNWVMALSNKKDIVAVTRGADNKNLSPYADDAKNIPKHDGTLESILSHKPDRVVGDIYMNPAVINGLKRLNIPYFEIPISEKLTDWQKITLQAGKILYQNQKAKNLIETMMPVWNEINKEPHHTHQKPVAVIFRPAGYSVGTQSLAGDILPYLGVYSLSQKLGLKQTNIMSLENLIFYHPDIMIKDLTNNNHLTLSNILLSHRALKDYQKQIKTYSFGLENWFCLSPKTLPAVLRLKQHIATDFKDFHAKD
jgi:iron complex transport system substrate-binding protein